MSEPPRGPFGVQRLPPHPARFEELVADACRAAREEFEARTAQAMASNVRDRLLAEAWEARPGEVTWNSLLRRLNEALPVAGRVRYGTLRKWVRDGSADSRTRAGGRDAVPHPNGGIPARSGQRPATEAATGMEGTCEQVRGAAVGEVGALRVPPRTIGDVAAACVPTDQFLRGYYADLAGDPGA